MNKERYLEELRRRLSGRMQPNELENVMAYYAEYFDEAGQAHEGEVLEELGSPERLSHQILGDQVAKELERPDYRQQAPRRSGLNRVWTVVLALFAAPIAIPLALGLAAVAMALVVAAFALVVGIGAGGAACIAVGGFIAFSGLGVVLSEGVATTMYFVGGGLISAGVGVLLLLAAVGVAGLCFNGIAKLLSRALRRKQEV